MAFKYSTDYDVALKLLETSGQLPRIITQLEQGFISFITT